MPTIASDWSAVTRRPWRHALAASVALAAVVVSTPPHAERKSAATPPHGLGASVCQPTLYLLSNDALYASNGTDLASLTLVANFPIEAGNRSSALAYGPDGALYTIRHGLWQLVDLYNGPILNNSVPDALFTTISSNATYLNRTAWGLALEHDPSAARKGYWYDQVASQAVTPALVELDSLTPPRFGAAVNVTYPAHFNRTIGFSAGVSAANLYMTTVDGVYWANRSDATPTFVQLLFTAVFGISANAVVAHAPHYDNLTMVDTDFALTADLTPQQVYLEHFPPPVGHAVNATWRACPFGGVRASPTWGQHTAEEGGGSTTIGYVLTAPPTGNVTLTLESDTPSEGSVSPSTLTFTTANWHILQNVTVTGVEDATIDGDQTYHVRAASVISPDPAYSNRTVEAATLINLDDDVDTDADTIVDEVDNCPAIANLDQADFDRDGIGNACDATLSGPSGYFAATPCRLLDTRLVSDGPALAGGTTRQIVATGRCGIPADAVAVSVNVTVVRPSAPGRVTIGPSGADDVWAVAFRADQTRANNGIVQLDGSGDGSFYITTNLLGGDSVDVIVDVSGWLTVP